MLGTLTASVIGLATIHLNAAGLAAVQSWIDDPATNHGLIIQDYANASNGVDFVSRAGPSAASRPNLTITYSGNDITPLNTAPVVDAGPDQDILLTEEALLDGSVVDDQLPDPPGVTTKDTSRPMRNRPVIPGPASTTVPTPSKPAGRPCMRSWP